MRTDQLFQREREKAVSIHVGAAFVNDSQKFKKIAENLAGEILFYEMTTLYVCLSLFDKYVSE